MSRVTSWRPKDWKNPFHFVIDTMGNTVYGIFNPEKAIIFEAGADKILDAVRNNQLSPFDPTVMQANFKGKVVVIPDDEVDGGK